MYACYGILSALVNRLITGEGQQVETSLLRASVSFIAENAARYFETGHVPRRSHRTKTAGVFAFVDEDGLAFVLHMSSPDKFWRAMFEVVGHPEWSSDARFKDRRSRVENYDTLAEALQVIFGKGKRDEWLRRLQEKDVRADVDERDETVSKRIRDAEVEKVPYVIVVGDRESEQSLAVRRRGGEQATLSVEELREELATL